MEALPALAARFAGHTLRDFRTIETLCIPNRFDDSFVIFRTEMMSCFLRFALLHTRFLWFIAPSHKNAEL
jgi:hypothetical protein